MEELYLTEEERAEIFLRQKRKNEKSRLKKTAALIGLAYFVHTLLNFVISFALVLGALLMGKTEELNKLLEDSAFMMFMQIGVSVCIFILPYLAIAPGLGKKLGKLLPFGLPAKGTFFPLVLMGLGFCAFGNMATNVISILFSLVGIDFTSPELEYPTGIAGVLLTFLAMSIVPALVEEFAMRGVVLGGLRDFGKGFSIVVSALIFGMMHNNFVQMPFAFIVGLALGFAAIKSGSIWTAVTIHFLNNAISVVLDLLFEKITTPEYQSIIMSIVFAIYLLCFFVGLAMTRKNSAEFWKRDKTDCSLTVGEQIGCFFLSPVIIFDIIVTFILSLAYVSI